MLVNERWVDACARKFFGCRWPPCTGGMGRVVFVVFVVSVYMCVRKGEALREECPTYPARCVQGAVGRVCVEGRGRGGRTTVTTTRATTAKHTYRRAEETLQSICMQRMQARWGACASARMVHLGRGCLTHRQASGDMEPYTTGTLTPAFSHTLPP